MSEVLDTQPEFDKGRLAAIGISLVVTIIWSSTFVIVKIGLETLGPLTIAGLRYFIGALILFPFLVFQKTKKALITKDLWIRMILIGISSYTIGNGALFWGLKFIPATTGSLLMSAIPLLVLSGGAIFLKEIPTKLQIFGVILTLVGSAVFFSSGLKAGEPKGLIIVALGLIGFTTFSLLGRGIARERSLDTLTLTTFPLAIGGFTTIILALLVEGFPQFTLRGVIIVIWLAVINTAIGYWLYNYALRDMTALEMNMIMNLTPLFTAFISWVMLAEKLRVIQIVGMLIMILGVIIVQRVKPNQRLST